jgi:16S rRNA (cytosine1402-N4)-methyltransferase
MILNEYPPDRIKALFRLYGEVPSVGRLVGAVVQFRENQLFETTTQLKELVEPLAPKRDVNKYLAQVFQALRIEVNGEMAALQEVLQQLPGVVKPGGRMVVMTYHSLEDRLVKNFIRTGHFKSSQAETDIFGHKHIPFRAINRKVIQPDPREIEQNPRARSAKLRVAERL